MAFVDKEISIDKSVVESVVISRELSEEVNNFDVKKSSRKEDGREERLRNCWFIMVKKPKKSYL